MWQGSGVVVGWCGNKVARQDSGVAIWCGKVMVVMSGSVVGVVVVSDGVVMCGGGGVVAWRGSIIIFLL